MQAIFGKKEINILYIEDNYNDFLITQRLLARNREGIEGERFNIEQADRVSKGLERLKKGNIDLVLTDLHLPDTRELEAVTILHSHFPSTPIIALTSSYNLNLGVEAVRKGAQDYLLKDELTDLVIKHAIRYAIERSKLEKLKDEFVSTVSHELITPLTIMKGGVDNLKLGVAGPLNPRQQEILNGVLKNVDRLAKILKDILDLSRLEIGHLRINRVQVNPKSLIEEVVAIFQNELKDKKIAIEQNVNCSTMLADQGSINQVLTNLLSNALHYARSKISLTAEKVDGSICISIMDDGIGISKEDQGKLFNKFQQINRQEGGQGYKGTGLGLAICKEIIDLHKGKIWVESDLGQGAKFSFSIPLEGDNA